MVGISILLPKTDIVITSTGKSAPPFQSLVNTLFFLDFFYSVASAVLRTKLWRIARLLNPPAFTPIHFVEPLFFSLVRLGHSK